MKYLFYILAGFLITTTSAQQKYLTRTGTVIFEASVPSFEEVKAKNESTTAILNTENGEFAALLLVKGFRFKNALMEEHFNENYAESDKYSKAKFKGNISSFSMENISNKATEFFINGELSFHGVTKALEAIPIKIKSVNDQINIEGRFETKASDYDIEIPKIVRNKISEKIEVYFKFELIMQ